MTFARWTFRLAGLYGLAVLLPMYFHQRGMASADPPLIHPEYYYGFIGVAVAWQVAFLLIGRDPWKCISSGRRVRFFVKLE